jgi:hypothetical protein
MKYVAICPMKGKSFKICAGLVVVDGAVEVPEAIHKSYGHVLRADWGVLPESEVVIEVPTPSLAGNSPEEHEVIVVATLDEPKQEQTVADEYPPPVIHAETAEVKPVKGRRK